MALCGPVEITNFVLNPFCESELINNEKYSFKGPQTISRTTNTNTES